MSWGTWLCIWHRLAGSIFNLLNLTCADFKVRAMSIEGREDNVNTQTDTLTLNETSKKIQSQYAFYFLAKKTSATNKACGKYFDQNLLSDCWWKTSNRLSSLSWNITQPLIGSYQSIDTEFFIQKLKINCKFLVSRIKLSTNYCSRWISSGSRLPDTDPKWLRSPMQKHPQIPPPLQSTPP